MKSRSLPARTRTTRGGGRRVRRRAGIPVSPALLPTVAHAHHARAYKADGLPPAGEGPEAAAPDESLYQLGDGSDAPSIDVRADVQAEAAPDGPDARS